MKMYAVAFQGQPGVHWCYATRIVCVKLIQLVKDTDGAALNHRCLLLPLGKRPRKRAHSEGCEDEVGFAAGSDVK